MSLSASASLSAAAGMPEVSLCHVYCRVRPFFESEKNVVPDGSVVARSIIDAGAGTPSTFTVLDPSLMFRPKKNATFLVDRTFCDFTEPFLTVEEAAPRVAEIARSSDLLYSAVGSRMVEAITQGYCAGLVICGAAKTGKTYTLFGDTAPASLHAKGIIPRVAEGIFDALKLKPTNTKCSVELEFVEVQSDSVVVDLFKSTKGTGSSAPSSATSTPSKLALSGSFVASNSSTDLVKIREEGDVVSLSNTTRTKVETAVAFNSAVRSGLKHARKAKASHIILLVHILETTNFRDPKAHGNSVVKNHATRAAFAIVSGAPTTLFRCVDTAAKREAGEVHLKVPSRESALTRILGAEFFGGNCRSHMIACVSPFVEHAKETIQSLGLAARFFGVRNIARLVIDTETLQFRRLQDEVSGLEQQLVQVHSSRQIVQDELDRRHGALQDATVRLELQTTALRDAVTCAELEARVVSVKKLRYEIAFTKDEEQLEALSCELTELRAEESMLRKQETVLNMSAVRNQQCVEEEDAARLAAENEMAELKPKLAEFEARYAFVAAVNEFDGGAKHDEMVATHAARMTELNEQREKEEALVAEVEKEFHSLQQKHRVTKLAYDSVVAVETEARQAKSSVGEKEDELKSLEAEIAALEGDVKALDDEIKAQPPPGCCSVQ